VSDATPEPDPEGAGPLPGGECKADPEPLSDDDLKAVIKFSEGQSELLGKECQKAKDQIAAIDKTLAAIKKAKTAVNESKKLNDGQKDVLNSLLDEVEARYSGKDGARAKYKEALDQCELAKKKVDEAIVKLNDALKEKDNKKRVAIQVEISKLMEAADAAFKKYQTTNPAAILSKFEADAAMKIAEALLKRYGITP